MIASVCRSIGVLAVVLILSACAEVDPSVQGFQQVVTPVQTDETANVPALVLARGMAETGFTREEILDYGPAIRNALARAGGAQIANGTTTLAMASVMDGQLFIVTRDNGTAVIPVTGHPGY